MTPTPRRIEDLQPAPYNPRTIDAPSLEALKASLGTFGDLSGITFNERTGHLVTGHQRVRVLREQHGESARIRHAGKEAYLHVGSERFRLRVVNWDEETERAANIAANSPLLAGIFTDDLPDLVALAQEELPELTDALRFDDLLETLDMGPEPIELQDDEVPEPPANPVTKPGDVWTLGDHRLICGDAQDPGVVAALLGDHVPLLMITDPPYGVEYEPEWRERDLGEKHAGRRSGIVRNDDCADWREAFTHFTGDVAYVWHASLFGAVVLEGLAAARLGPRAQIIWAKPQGVISRGHYQWAHEPAWYAVRRGRSARWSGDRCQSTLWRISNQLRASEGKTDHSTQKPLECMGRPMRNHGKVGDGVYDPFVGSGTTLIAAEQLERRCFAIEIDPGYCDVAVERWESLTGSKANRCTP